MPIAHAFFASLWADFAAIRVDFRVSRTPLNMPADLKLTSGGGSAELP
jgi:hypothetical protein